MCVVRYSFLPDTFIAVIYVWLFTGHDVRSISYHGTWSKGLNVIGVVVETWVRILTPSFSSCVVLPF